VILYPKKSSAFLLLLVCSVFVAVGLWVGSKEGWPAYLCAAFFAVGILAAIIQMLPGSSSLRVDEKGLTIVNLFRASEITWEAVDHFCVVTMAQTGVKVHEMVGINFAPSYDAARLGRQFAKAITGCEGALPDTYGKKADELAAFLNARLREFKNQVGQARQRAVIAGPSSPEIQTSN
jgi:Bacterial PH domain